MSSVGLRRRVRVGHTGRWGGGKTGKCGGASWQSSPQQAPFIPPPQHLFCAAPSPACWSPRRNGSPRFPPSSPFPPQCHILRFSPSTHPPFVSPHLLIGNRAVALDHLQVSEHHPALQGGWGRGEKGHAGGAKGVILDHLQVRLAVKGPHLWRLLVESDVDSRPRCCLIPLLLLLLLLEPHAVQAPALSMAAGEHLAALEGGAGAASAPSSSTGPA